MEWACCSVHNDSLSDLGHIPFPFTLYPLSLAVAVNPRVEMLTVPGPVGCSFPRHLTVNGDLQTLKLLRVESPDVSPKRGIS